MQATSLGSETIFLSYTETILKYYTKQGLKLLFAEHPELKDHMMKNFDPILAAKARLPLLLHRCAPTPFR